MFKVLCIFAGLLIGVTKGYSHQTDADDVRPEGLPECAVSINALPLKQRVQERLQKFCEQDDIGDVLKLAQHVGPKTADRALAELDEHFVPTGHPDQFLAYYFLWFRNSPRGEQVLEKNPLATIKDDLHQPDLTEADLQALFQLTAENVASFIAAANADDTPVDWDGLD